MGGKDRATELLTSYVSCESGEREDIICELLSLVDGALWNIAREMHNPDSSEAWSFPTYYTSATVDDVHSEAVLAFVDLAPNFSPERGSRASTFIYNNVPGKTYQRVLEADGLFDVPHSFIEKMNEAVVGSMKGWNADVQSVSRKIKKTNSETQPSTAIAEAVLLRRSGHRISLNDCVRIPDPELNGEYLELNQTRADDLRGEQGSLELLLSADRQQIVRELLRIVPQRHANFLMMHFGADMTWNDIGEALGMSAMTTTKLRKKLFGRLHALLYTLPEAYLVYFEDRPQPYIPRDYHNKPIQGL